MLKRNTLLLFLAGAFAGAQIAAADTLHGFCVSPTPACTDNNTITPTNTNPPKFGFQSSGTTEYNFELLLLVPNNEDMTPGSFSMTINGTNVTNTSRTSHLFSSTAFTSNTLGGYLGLLYNPDEPLSSLLPSTQAVDSGATGYYVYTFLFGMETGNPKNTSTAPTFSITSGSLPLGSEFLGLELNSDGVQGSTPPSGAIIEDAPPTPTVPEPATAGFVGFGLVAAAWFSKRAVRARNQN